MKKKIRKAAKVASKSMKRVILDERNLVNVSDMKIGQMFVGYEKQNTYVLLSIEEHCVTCLVLETDAVSTLCILTSKGWPVRIARDSTATFEYTSGVSRYDDN